MYSVLPYIVRILGNITYLFTSGIVYAVALEIRHGPADGVEDGVAGAQVPLLDEGDVDVGVLAAGNDLENFVARASCRRHLHRGKVPNQLIVLRPVLKAKLSSERRSGADVMITIFCNFCQFSARKIGVFLKCQYGKVFAKIDSSLSKTMPLFVKNIFKMITSVPVSSLSTFGPMAL
jgi:hypothetical protein